ncbi:MAG: hypothetical protein R3A48_13660 [Polyangiales bacterium]
MSAATRLACALLLGACTRSSPPARPAPVDVVAPQVDRPAPDVPPPPPPVETLTAPVSGASTDPPLRALDPTMAVPRWQGEGTASITVPRADGPVEGTLQAGDLTLRVRGYRSGETLRAQLEPASVDVDGGAWVWRGMLDARVAAGALRGTWSVSALGGRFARAGTLGAR